MVGAGGGSVDGGWRNRTPGGEGLGTGTGQLTGGGGDWLTGQLTRAGGGVLERTPGVRDVGTGQMNSGGGWRGRTPFGDRTAGRF